MLHATVSAQDDNIPDTWDATNVEGRVQACLQHMFKRLQQISGRGVGVVGLAHLDGIEQRWKDWQSRDRSRKFAS